MGISKYFTVNIKPTIIASKQTGVFTTGDVVFDWTSFTVPKGAKRIIGITVLMRGPDGVAQKPGLELYFASTDDNSLGTVNATADGVGFFNDLLGMVEVGASEYGSYIDTMSVADTASRRNVLLPKTPEANKSGYDTFYIGCLAVTSNLPSWVSTVIVDGVQATSQARLTCKTSSAAKSFAVGDIIHDEDDRLMGTVKSVDSATQMTMEDNLANASVDDKDLYNISPMAILLHFES